MSFVARAGHPCGADFLAADFLEHHPEYSWQKPLLRDMKAGPWTSFRRGKQMKETVQQYIQRINGYTEGKQPLAVQAATAKKLERLIKGVPTSKLRKRPAPGKWSVSEILAHLADAEIVGGFRMRLILGAPGTPIAAFDQDAWVISGHYEKRDPRKSVEQFRVVREANLALAQVIDARAMEALWNARRARAGNDRTSSFECSPATISIICGRSNRYISKKYVLIVATTSSYSATLQ